MKSANSIPAKERRKRQILEYCGNPANPFPNRLQIATEICKYRDSSGLYRLFNAAELAEIEQEALRIRRAKYAPHIAKVDIALLQKAIQGDVQACRLAYERLEGWSPRQKTEHSVENDSLARLLKELDHKTRILPRLTTKT